MIDLYYWPTPNGHKITLFLEEAGLPYRVVPVDIGRGRQFDPEFLKISPNNRIPAIVDHEPPDGGGPLSVFESGAILVYLAEKTGKFLPADPRGRKTTPSGRSGGWAGPAPWRRFEQIRERPATKRACERAKAVREAECGIDATAKKVPFGQGAHVVW